MRDELKDRLDQWAEQELARAGADHADTPIPFLAAARSAANTLRDSANADADAPPAPLALRLRPWLPLAAAACIALTIAAIILAPNPGPPAHTPITSSTDPADTITITEDPTIGPTLADIMRASNNYADNTVVLPKDTTTTTPGGATPPVRAMDRAEFERR